MSAPTPFEPRPGDRIDGRFRVIDCIDRGRASSRFAVHDEVYDQPTSVVLVRGDDPSTARFLREARLMATIVSPHAPRVFAVGDLPGGAAYVAMEELEGADGYELLEGGPLSVERAVDVALQALDGLAFAHAGGILHCEINPGAILSTSGPEGELVKLVDFRFSTSARTGGDETLHHAAPEQLRAGAEIDERADVYSIGAVLYELLSGTPAIGGSTHDEVARNVAQATPRPLRDVRPDVPLALSAAVACCLEKDPAKRYESVGDLAPALAPHGSGAFAHCVARAQIVLGKGPHASSGTRVAVSRFPAREVATEDTGHGGAKSA